MPVHLKICSLARILKEHQNVAPTNLLYVYVLLGKTLLVEKPIPASYIQVEKAVAAIAENLQNEMPVLEEPQFR